jgi:succinate dehydrogenase/fumarate reductase cytochrome b subunit
MANTVDHPPHYGGEGNPYEVIKVIEAWGLGFHLGNAVKYIARAGSKGEEEDEVTDLRKAVWYINRQIENLTKGKPNG